MGEGENMEFHGDRSNIFTVFMDNLPNSISKEWLWKIFKFEGEIVDIILSKPKKSLN